MGSKATVLPQRLEEQPMEERARRTRDDDHHTPDPLEVAWLSMALSGGIYVPPLEDVARHNAPDDEAADAFLLVSIVAVLLLITTLLMLAAAVA
jgi:hypothetical protein